MDRNKMRESTLREALRLGYEVAQELPFLDETGCMKAPEEIIGRLLCLHATAACAYGMDFGMAHAWLREEGVITGMSTSERRFIESGVGDVDQFKFQVEGMWALAWSIGLSAELDFRRDCDDDFVMLLPNIQCKESSTAIRAQMILRPDEEMVAACDLAYCLHWSIRQAQLNKAPIPGKVQPYVVIERRRALEWLLNETDWDEVVLDT